jgi:Protein of unknown function (DUF2586)
MISFELENGGLGRRSPQDDSICGFIATGVAAGSVTLGNPYALNSIQDLIDLGISAAYDEDNEVFVYEHIKEVFGMNPNATVWFMLVAQSVAYEDLVDPTNANTAIKLINASNGTIRQLAASFNPTAAIDYENPDLPSVVAMAQTFAQACFDAQRPCVVLLEGAGIDLSHLPNVRTLNSRYVSLAVGQNYDVLDIHQYAITYAAVGTLLGTVSLAAVNEDIAWVEKFNLLGRNLNKVSVGGTLVSALSDSRKTELETKGLIYMKTYSDFAGIYFNDSHNGDVLTSDFAYIENTRTVQKAMRLVRQALLPKLNSPINVNPDSGLIDPVTIAALEALGNRAILPMFQASEISGPDPSGSTPPFTIDPNQDILSTSELVCQLAVVPVGVARTIRVQIGFTNPNV